MPNLSDYYHLIIFRISWQTLKQVETFRRLSALGPFISLSEIEHLTKGGGV